jgi:hypothetical protein
VEAILAGWQPAAAAAGGERRRSRGYEGMVRTVATESGERLKMPKLQPKQIPRRRVLQAALAVAGGIAASNAARAADDEAAGNHAEAPSAPAKLTQEAVQYQPTPKDWQKCLFCTYFQAPNTCGIVSGAVSAQGWCTRFALLHE